MQIQTVTDLVNKLFDYYECNFSKLDWDEKLDEYVDDLNDCINYNDNLDEIYSLIKEKLPYTKLPKSGKIKNVLSKSKQKTEIMEYVEHPDNGKLVLVICYKNGEIAQIRKHVMMNTPDTDRSLYKETKLMREIYDEVKVRIYPADVVLIGKKLHIPEEYNKDGECIKQRIEEIA